MNFTSHFTCQNFLLELIGCVVELIPNGRINEIMDGGRSGWLVAAVNGNVGRGIDGPCQMHGMKPNLLLLCPTHEKLSYEDEVLSDYQVLQTTSILLMIENNENFF